MTGLLWRAGQTQRLVELGCLRALLAVLRERGTVPGLVNVSLRTLAALFASGEAGRDAHGANQYVAEFRRLGGEASVRGCRGHVCRLISTTAGTMVDTYLHGDALE